VAEDENTVQAWRDGYKPITNRTSMGCATLVLIVEIYFRCWTRTNILSKQKKK
jgi:hypothetical protein